MKCHLNSLNIMYNDLATGFLPYTLLRHTQKSDTMGPRSHSTCVCQFADSNGLISTFFPLPPMMAMTLLFTQLDNPGHPVQGSSHKQGLSKSFHANGLSCKWLFSAAEQGLLLASPTRPTDQRGPQVAVEALQAAGWGPTTWAFKDVGDRLKPLQNA